MRSTLFTAVLNLVISIGLLWHTSVMAQTRPALRPQLPAPRPAPVRTGGYPQNQPGGTSGCGQVGGVSFQGGQGGQVRTNPGRLAVPGPQVVLNGGKMYTSGVYTRIWESPSPTADPVAGLKDGQEVGVLGYIQTPSGIWAVVAVSGPDNSLIVGYVMAVNLRPSPDPIPLQPGPGGPEPDPRAYPSIVVGVKG